MTKIGEDQIDIKLNRDELWNTGLDLEPDKGY